MEAIVAAAKKLIEGGVEKAREQGTELAEQSGRLKERREIGTRLMERRFALTAHEPQLIATQSEVDRLDAAMSAAISAVAHGAEGSKVEVLKYLSA